MYCAFSIVAATPGRQRRKATDFLFEKNLFILFLNICADLRDVHRGGPDLMSMAPTKRGGVGAAPL